MMPTPPLSDPSRRRFGLQTVSMLIGAGFAGCAAVSEPGKPLTVGALFAGRIDDKGFMEAGWRGLERARTVLGAQTRTIDAIAPQKALLAEALTRLAGDGADLVIAHGGQNNEACAEVAQKFAQTRFVVTQGSVTGANLASYDVLQEESAWLAGVLAALTTRTGVVGHMSGIRVRPGLKGRAAYAAGVRATNPAVKLLTNFSGNQDDNALSNRIALAQINAGADVIFTMLNAGRDGVTQACRARGVRQIGNVVDWVATDPQVFIGSAIADVGRGVFEAVREVRDGRFPAGTIRKVGIATEGAVRLSVAADVPSSVQARIASDAAAIATGQLKVPEGYEGPEFSNPA